MRLFLGAVFLAATICLLTSARADPNTPSDPSALPSHTTICVGDKVHKSYLINYIRAKINNPKNQDAQVFITGELQTRLFTTDAATFCAMATKPKCGAGSNDKECQAANDSCLSYQNDAVIYAQYIFRILNKESALPAPAYAESSGLRGLQPYQQVNRYFNNLSDNENPIVCTRTDIAPSPSTAQKDNSTLAKFRVRGRSDDLYIDRTTPQFKSTTPASISWTGSDKNNYSVKVNAALGYEFDVGTDGQFIPYLSANQSDTDAAKKPRIIDPTNNVAVGFLATTFFSLPGNSNVENVVTAKPQYLFNAANRSEVASIRLIYAPWTDIPNIPINANTFQILPFLPGPTWASLIFDLRNDSGVYTNRGSTPAVIAVDKDFDRVGTRVGLTLTNDPTFPSLTLMIVENYLYGLAGYYRNVSSFQASLTYNLESNNYFGITASYQNGRDEDTAVASHTYTVGLTVRY